MTRDFWNLLFYKAKLGFAFCKFHLKKVDVKSFSFFLAKRHFGGSGPTFFFEALPFFSCLDCRSMAVELKRPKYAKRLRTRGLGAILRQWQQHHNGGTSRWRSSTRFKALAFTAGTAAKRSVDHQKPGSVTAGFQQPQWCSCFHPDSEVLHQLQPSLQRPPCLRAKIGCPLRQPGHTAPVGLIRAVDITDALVRKEEFSPRQSFEGRQSCCLFISSSFSFTMSVSMSLTCPPRLLVARGPL